MTDDKRTKADSSEMDMMDTLANVAYHIIKNNDAPEVPDE